MADSLDVSRFVWESFNHFGKKQILKDTFVNNDSACTLVDDYELRFLMSSGNIDDYFNALSQDIQTGEKALISLNHMLKNKVSPTGKSTMSGIFNKVAGTSGIQEIRNEASQAIELYGKLIDCYESAKNGVKEVSNDFVDLRAEILHIYEKYVMLLIDFFGDSIKSVAPELFNFDSIEYLDTSAMFEHIKLQYDELSENCSALVGMISENFANSLQSAAQNRKTLGRSGALAIAAINFISHRIDAKEKEVMMQQEFEKLKMNIKRDVNNISADGMRLKTIFDTIDKYYIPKSQAYLNFSDQILSKEFSDLLHDLYEKGGVAELLSERDALNEQLLHSIEENNDHTNNINYYKQNICQCEHFLKEKEDDDVNVKASKPSKPNFIVNLLTLGSANNTYNRKVYEWSLLGGKVVKEYDNFKADIALDSAELDSHQKAKSNLDEEIKKMKAKQKMLSKKILEKLSTNSDIKKSLAYHLEDIVKLLYIGKTILESKLDEKSIKAIHFDTYHTNELPQETKESLNCFIDSVCKIGVNNKDKIANNLINSEGIPVNSDTIESVINSGARLAKSLIELNLLREQNKIAIAKYDAKVMEIQQEFKYQMSIIDNKADALTKILIKLDKSTTIDARKQALLLLGKDFQVFKCESELDDFLNGKLNITL